MMSHRGFIHVFAYFLFVTATFSSYLEYLNEQNRQLAAKLEGSDDAVITLSNEIERLCTKYVFFKYFAYIYEYM